MGEIKLWDHQVQCVEKANRIGSLALFMEVGTGKTASTVHILRHRYNSAKAILPTLIFAPPVVLKNWRKEILAHSKTPPERIVVLSGSGVQRLKTFAAANAKFNGCFIAVTNYEAVQMKDLYAAFSDWLGSFTQSVLVCDESHRLKSHKALRTKAVIGLADLARYRYILTGTPVLNNPADLFSQFRVLDGGETFGRNFFAFQRTYFYDKNAGMPKHRYFPNWQPRPQIEKLFGQMIEEKSFQARKSECLTLPPLVRQKIEVELSKEQRKAYDEMLKSFVTFVKESACVAELAITKTLRLQQILSGFVRTDDDQEISFGDVPRLEALSDLLEDLVSAEKVIVWCNFKRNYLDVANVCERLGIRYVLLTGEQTTAEKEKSVEAFETDPEVRVIIGNPQAGGVGINLIAASHMIYYTRNYSLENDIQSEARNYRGGSERHVKITRTDIVAPDTLDELVLKALEGKQNVAQTILDFARSL